MKLKVLKSIFTVFLLAVIVAAGTTMAFFHDSDSPAPLYMTAGTIDFEIDPLDIDLTQPEPGQLPEWRLKESKTFCWLIHNTGSKRFMLRVKPRDTSHNIPELPQINDGSAWGKGEKLPVNSWGPMYFEYIVGNYDEDNPFVTDIIADQHYIVGAIKVWNDSEKIYVKYDFDYGYTMSESHLFIGEALEDIPINDGTVPPGLLPFKGDHDRVEEYEFVRPLFGTYPQKGKPTEKKEYSWEEGDLLYIVAHAGGVRGPGTQQPGNSCNYNLTWSAAPGSPLELITVNGETWWRYTGNPVPPGQSIRICLQAELPDGVPAGTVYEIYLEAEAFQATNDAPSYW